MCSVLQGMLSSGLRMCCVLQGMLSSSTPLSWNPWSDTTCRRNCFMCFLLAPWSLLAGTGSVRQVSVPASRFPRLGSQESRFARLGSQESRFARLGSPASLSTVGVGEPLANRALRTEPVRTEPVRTEPLANRALRTEPLRTGPLPLKLTPRAGY